ncbi:hypothetical protein [Vibrio parahaemolyticus]|uniref:hypothetical protein n=1 Tax=Vibrio parahaemolyticus TaxID=670 RepID=UPI00111E07C8|nr:hypothetical protein [Vibrio parahaemolyticus]TNY97756.1 hypothetical protein CGK57_14305 [Vibrio parahaemolyticus]
MSNIIEIDFSKKLEITIDNRLPVGLEDLSLSLLSFNKQFHKFVESETDALTDVGSELLIKEVRKGSIVVELVSQAAPIVPLIWEGGSLAQWASVVQNTCNWLLGNTNHPPKEMTKQDLQEWNKIVEPIAKDHGSQMNINVSDGGKVINQFILNSAEAAAIQNRIGRLVEDIDTPQENKHLKKVMYWYQTKFDPNSDTGNKAIIDDISKSALKVIFENNALKEAMLHPDPSLGKPWQELAFVVDVEVQTVRGKPKMYNVLNYYPEYTFDPDEE